MLNEMNSENVVQHFTFPLFHHIVDYYNLHLEYLMPNTILSISTFVYLCEPFRVRPCVALFFFIFCSLDLE
jgi:hypothetical protein